MGEDVSHKSRELQELRQKLAELEAEHARQHRTEEALAASEERFRVLFETMSQGVVYQDRTGEIISANPAALKILGLTLDQLLGRTSTDPRWRTLKEDGSHFPGDEHPAMVALATGQAVKDVIMGIFNPATDETSWILVSATPQFRPEEGDPFQVYTTFQDITELRRAGDAIRESEERFRSIVESSPMGIHLYRLEAGDRLVFTGANQAADRILGVDNQVFVGKTLEQAFPPLNDTEVPAQYRRVCAEGVTWQTEQIDYHDHQIRGAYEVYAFRTGPLAMAVMFLDITERKRVEEALRRSEESYREIFDATHDAIFIHDAATGSIVDVNRAMLEAYGYAREEVLDLSLNELSSGEPPFTQEEAEKRIRLAVDRGPQVFEWRSRHKNGSLFWTEVALKSTQIGGKGRVLAVVRDITERKEGEAALRSSESRYRTLFEAAGNALSLVRGEACVDCNPQAEALFQRTREELIGMSPSDLSPPLQPDGSDSREKIQELAVRALAGEAFTFEWTHCRPDGSLFEVEVSLNRLEISGEPLLLANIRDITQEKRLSERLRQLQQMETVGQLAGGVAHDFNNLLTPILGYAELLLQELGEGDTRRSKAEEILRAGERAHHVTSQLLALSRRQVLEMSVLDLNRIIIDMWSMLRRTIREDIEIQLRQADSLGYVRGDTTQIEQILMNLALNAQDAMPAGGVLRLETANLEMEESDQTRVPDLRPGPYVSLTVVDTGTGMDRSTLEHVFEPFFTTKEVGKGTGLGLSTVFGIVKQHGGTVTAQSEPGQGTRVSVYLPTVDADLSQETAATEVHLKEGGDETVVVVEDDELVRRLACTVLRTHGYHVIENTLPRDCLEQLQDHQGPVHLLLTDVVMPGMNGRQLYGRLSSTRPNLKVLYMSGYSEDVVASHGVLHEGVRLIQKPFSVAALTRMVREVLDS